MQSYCAVLCPSRQFRGLRMKVSCKIGMRTDDVRWAKHIQTSAGGESVKGVECEQRSSAHCFLRDLDRSFHFPGIFTVYLTLNNKWIGPNKCIRPQLVTYVLNSNSYIQRKKRSTPALVRRLNTKLVQTGSVHLWPVLRIFCFSLCCLVDHLGWVMRCIWRTFVCHTVSFCVPRTEWMKSWENVQRSCLRWVSSVFVVRFRKSLYSVGWKQRTWPRTVDCSDRIVILCPF